MRLIRHLRLSLLALLVLVSTFSSRQVSRAAISEAAGNSINGHSPVVAHLYFSSKAELDRLAAELDIWEVHPKEGYLIAMLSQAQASSLAQSGQRLEVDLERTALLNQPNTPLPGQVLGIPGYPCYRTVEETYANLSTLAANHPGLAKWVDIGDSWDKVVSNGSQGYDLFALVLTNQVIPGPKPVFFLMGAIHAREYVTAETATRFAEYLVQNYGSDPEVTWLLDYNEIHIVPQANPDGRKLAETGLYWRKNVDNDDGCYDSDSWGVDLNRNSDFKWGSLGASSNPCAETYHGPSPSSEPEVQAIQNYVLSIFPDQRGPADSDPAPADAMGTFITLHSYSQLVLWPWGWTSNPAPNRTALRTLGRKLAFFNGYTPEQSDALYATSGSTDDWAYGLLGVAAYTIEMGTSFLQDCPTFEGTIYPDHLQALLYAAKTAQAPYRLPAGPDMTDLVASPAVVPLNGVAHLQGKADDTRYNNTVGTEPVHRISEVSYTIDIPPWSSNPVPVAFSMTPADGALDSTVETVQADLDTSNLSPGRHTLFMRARDASGAFGATSAVFIYIFDPATASVIEGYVREQGNNAPLAAALTAGSFRATTDPASGYYHLELPSGTYDITASAKQHVSATIQGITLQEGEGIQQDFSLSPICTIFFDDVERGNLGWTSTGLWTVTTESAHSPLHAWTDSPGGGYGNDFDTSITSWALNLAGLSSLSLSFWNRYDTEAGYDFVLVDYSTDGGNSWMPAWQRSGAQLSWQKETIDLSELDGQPDARIRFRLKSDALVTADGWYVDDIHLTGAGQNCTTSFPYDHYLPMLLR